MKAFEIYGDGEVLGLYAAESKEDALRYYADDKEYESVDDFRETYSEIKVLDVPLPV